MCWEVNKKDNKKLKKYKENFIAKKKFKNHKKGFKMGTNSWGIELWVSKCKII